MLLDVEARWSINIAAYDLWIQTLQSDIELVNVQKEVYYNTVNSG